MTELDQKKLENLANEIVAALAGKNFDGSPNDGLISAMGQLSAKERIMNALSRSEFMKAKELK